MEKELTKEKICPLCNGTGYIVSEHAADDGESQPTRQPCACIRAANLLSQYPFLRPHYPLTGVLCDRVRQYRDQMNVKGVHQFQVIWCKPGITDAERRLLMLYRLQDTGAGNAYRLFGMHEAGMQPTKPYRK